VNPAKLEIELIPASAWGENLRSALPRAEWDRLRKQVYADAGNRCEICAGRGRRHPVECHEVWEFDERAGVQRLVRMIALCPRCHEAKHFGLAALRGREQAAREQLRKVNGWTPAELAEHISESFRVWESRSRCEWTLDLSVLAGRRSRV
jgi:hypothetical protein